MPTESDAAEPMEALGTQVSASTQHGEEPGR